ncbi:MAG: histone deacetylase family protein, partial [Thermodesulfobacteriota bacterium]
MAKYALVYSEKLREYEVGQVLTKDRYQHFIDLFQQTLGFDSDFEIVEPASATETDLKLIHTPDYIQRIERGEESDSMDTPLSPGLVRAAKLLAGAGKRAGELVQSGNYQKAFVVGGGVQHANRTQERGFGIFSDVGICAENLMRNHHLERILVIDTDAHAGEGIHDIFIEDPRVLCISLHQDPRTLYPGRGFIHEIGQGEGEGYNVNVPMPPMSGDSAYEYALNEIFVPLTETFQPQLILMVDGSDPHFTDRITQMGVTLKGIQKIGNLIGRVADDICGGKLIDFIGSGYSRSLQIVSLGWLASVS